MSKGVFAEHRDTEPAYPATSARLWSGVLLGTVMACFLIGGLTHVHDIVRGGWLPYRFAPDGINLFWSSLSVLDLLVVALLWLRRLSGVLLGLAVMLFDVAVNSYAAYVLGIFPSFLPLQLQTLFLGFLLGAAPMLCRQKSGRRLRVDAAGNVGA